MTRSIEDSEELAAGLSRLGFEPIVVPMVERRLFVDDVKAAASEEYDGWVVTSAAVVPALAACSARPRWIAAVGPKTARALQAAGLSATVVPTDSSVMGLAQALRGRAGDRVLYPVAARPTDGAVAMLRDVLPGLRPVTAYENVQPSAASASLRAAWPVDLVTACSSLTLERIAAVVPPPWEATLAVIGPRTAQTALKLGLPAPIVPSTPTIDELIAEIGRNIAPDSLS